MTASKNILLGKTGENLAKEYLITLGFEIVEMNWHYSKNSEIDIIAKDKNTLVFVEVKTRSSLNFGHPFEAIDQKKIKKIYMAALAYLEQTNINYKNYRIDAISVIGTKNPQIDHIKNVGLES